MPNQDWLVASDDPNVKECKDLKGKTVAADGINKPARCSSSRWWRTAA